MLNKVLADIFTHVYFSIFFNFPLYVPKRGARHLKFNKYSLKKHYLSQWRLFPRNMHQLKFFLYPFLSLLHQLSILVNQCVPGLKLTECASSTVPILDKSHFCRVNSDRINLQKKKKRMTKFKPIVLHIPEHDTRVHHHLVPPPSEPRTDLPLTRGHLQQAPYHPPPPHYHQFAPSLLV